MEKIKALWKTAEAKLSSFWFSLNEKLRWALIVIPCLFFILFLATHGVE